MTRHTGYTMRSGGSRWLWLGSWWMVHIFWLIHWVFSGTRGNGITLLVPFRTDYSTRARNWKWLELYWKAMLPGAQLIIGTDDNLPFCKTHAVNDAAERAHGDIFVILDADCYIDSQVIIDCADEIRAARTAKEIGYPAGPLWFIPYRHFYRLTPSATEVVLQSDPTDPYVFPDPPPDYDLETPEFVKYGHGYGALIQIMPREAFIAAGGMDERFRGWGSEDVSFMHAVDTMYGRHKTTDNGAFHLWHAKNGNTWNTRVWEGQTPGSNNKLGWRYKDARGQRAKMSKLVKEAIAFAREHR